MIETQDLDLVCAIVRLGTLRAASDVAHLTQPGMTRRIQALERRVGTRLFYRSGRKLRLTEAGEEFVRRSAEILDRVADLEREMGAYSRGQRGVLKIGATATVCLYLLPDILEQMRCEHPDYELYLANETSRAMPDLVRDGAVDIGVASISTPLAGLEVAPWRELHLGLLSRAPRERLSITRLDGKPLVTISAGSLRAVIDGALQAHRVSPRISAQADSLEVVKMLVSCGFGDAIVPLEVMDQGAAQSGLFVCPFEEDLAPLRVACFYRRLTPPLEALLEMMGVRPAERGGAASETVNRRTEIRAQCGGLT